MSGAANPQLAIRIAANVDELKKNLAEGRAAIEALRPSVEQLQQKWTEASATLVQNANNITAAMQGIGTSTMTAQQAASNLRVMDAAMAQLQRTGAPIPADMTATADALRAVSSNATSASPSVAGFAQSVTGIVQAGQAAMAALQSLGGVFQDWLAASSAEEDSTARMSTALRNQGTYSDELRDHYIALSEQYQKNTIYSHDNLAQTEATLAMIGGVMPKDMEAGLKAVTNLASGLRIDLETATTMVAKAAEGNTIALHKQGIEIDAMAVATQGATAVFDAINSKMKDGGAVAAATFSGQMHQLGNEFDDAKEALGRFVAAGLLPIISAFKALNPDVQRAIEIFLLLSGGAAALALAVAGIGAACAIAAPLLSGLATSAGAAGLSFGALALNPVVLGIMAVVAAGVLLHKTMTDATDALDKNAQALADHATIAALTSKQGELTAEEQAKLAEAYKRTSQAIHDSGFDQNAFAGALKEWAGGTTDYAQKLADLKAKIEALDPATQANIEAFIKMGGTAKQVAKEFGLLEDEQKVFAEVMAEHKKLADEEAAAEKAHAEALAQVRMAGASWRDTLQTMSPWFVDMIKNYEDAGIKAETLAKAFGIEQAAMDAIGESRKHDIELVKQQMHANEELVKADQEAMKTAQGYWAEYNAMRAEMYATATEKQIIEINKWAATEEAKIRAAASSKLISQQTLDDELDAMRHVAAQKLAMVGVDTAAITDAMTNHTIQGLRETAANAEKTYNLLRAANDGSMDSIVEKQRIAWETAQRAAEGFSTSAQQSIQQVGNASDMVTNKIALSWSQAMDLVRQGLGTMTGSVANTPASREKFDMVNQAYANHTYSGPVANGAPDYAALGLSQFLQWRAAGGDVQTGQPYIVGENGPELFVPSSSGSIVPNGGSSSGGSAPAGGMTVNVNVTQPLGTPQAIAKAVGDALMSVQRGAGIRFPLGV